ncbi:MAG: hypothetical protein ICV83_05685 [Cytophagales bacterium]|nr:hypothetical protein [Cytophagales bacterium]
MKKILIVLMIALGLSGAALAQSPNLERKITVRYEEAPLEIVLADLRKKYKLNFSYANQLIPLGQKVTLTARNQPLKVVLDAFGGFDVGYRVVGDQIVLTYQPRPKAEPTEGQSKVERPKYPALSKIEPGTGLVASNGAVTSQPVKPEMTPVNYVKPKWYEPYALIIEDALQKATKRATVAVQSIDDKIILKKPAPLPGPTGSGADSTQSPAVPTPPVAATDAAPDTILAQNDALSLVAASDSLPLADSLPYKTRPFQISFVTPLGTNGLESGRIVNHASFNLLAGYAAGLDGVEFAGFANVEKDFVRGVQFAGFANVVGGDVTAGQFAGFANVNGGVARGAQFAGFLNLTGDSVLAAQFAGFANIANGSAKGGQFAGFTNITKGSALGPQGAGFANIVKGSVGGPQFAGFLNTATGNVHGAQFAGFANVAGRDVRGAQVSGFVNVARKVRGVQIGVVNVADSVDGVQIGLFNFARHGYRRLELWGNEVMYANVAFKMGSKHFHNVFAVGGSADGEAYRWATGFGFGSEWNLTNRLLLNVDAIAWHVNENETWTEELNLLNQLRANLGFRLGKRAALFAGPTFNVYVSNLYNPESGRYGTDLARWNTTFDRQSGRTRVTMWPGINAGIRF